MSNKESVQEFLSRVSGIVNPMRSYGEILSNEIVVSKVLRSLTLKFDHVVAAIEETKDLSTYTFDELMSSLISHEARINRSHENSKETTFQVKEEFSKGGTDFHGRGRGGGRGRCSYGKSYKSSIQCRYYSKMGHKEAECWAKQREEQKQAHFIENVEEEDSLFMVRSPIQCDKSSKYVWFLDSGCSNHMSGNKSLFKELDE
ncbi:hypothetical protein HRI_002346000 [Hibiscus trionum]|uniref:Retrovirus-related Pol polyprotein from transposon TNT 1-94-like beta-barrel domain-containing protein n=1 Tax=Hibiscus trionum TaxID=183268 RepID=A0A9W7I0K2_HIBTR|nr:hypothetical protein HRI_002346000 [Hibiscus trionum]